MTIESGTNLGDWWISSLLGTGGMGTVYRVRNHLSGQIAAMKVLSGFSMDEERAQRFLREIRIMATLDHPNIPRFYTAQRIGDQVVLIMELVEGCTLESLMKQRRISIPDCVDYVSQVLLALDYAHAQTVVHRDIKPSNIMLTRRGTIKLMDFGIAKSAAARKLTQTGRAVGSLFYMSPEQIRDAANVDARSDLYSTGVVLYEMATGRRPFEADSDFSIMAAHINQVPPPPLQIDPELPTALNDIILRSLEKDPAKRFPNADAFRAALESDWASPIGNGSVTKHFLAV